MVSFNVKVNISVDSQWTVTGGVLCDTAHPCGGGTHLRLPLRAIWVSVGFQGYFFSFNWIV